MADVSVRPAQAGDATEIGRIQVETWRLAYRDVLPSAVLDTLSAQAAAESWADAIAAAPSPRHHVLVATEQEWRVGFVAFGPVDDGDLDDAERTGAAVGEPLGSELEHETTIALATILVEPRWGRRGHGSRLLAAAVDHARADGMTRAIGWIPEADSALRGFLLGAGWAPDGLARALDTGAGELREIRLHTALV